MNSTVDDAGRAPAARFGLAAWVSSMVVASQVHWLHRHGLGGERGWRLLLAGLVAAGVYGFARTAAGRRLCGRVPEFWDRWLSQSWVLVPGALADPLFPWVTLGAWGLALLGERLGAWSGLTRRLESWPRGWVIFGLMTGALALIVLRAPELFAEPRFWAEDGRWYRYACERSTWAMLALVQEYLVLYPNLVGALSAGLFSVERAPAVALYGVLLVQLAVLWVIAVSSARFLDTAGRKAVAMLLVLLIPPSAETWLVVVSAQYTLVLIAALILCEEREPASAARRWGYRGLLGIGGLTGVLVCVQTPLYAYKWYRTREREVAVQTGILAAASLIQLACMIWLHAQKHRGFGLPSWTTVSLVALNRHILEPINLGWAEWFWKAVQQWGDRALPAALAAAIVLSVYAWVWRQLRDDWRLRLMLLTALVMLGFSIVFAYVHGHWWVLIEPNAILRYFYAPNVLLALSLLGALQLWRRRGRAARSVASHFLVMVLLASGTLEYFALNEKSMPVYETRRPKWSEEVAKWRKDPNYEPRIWPTVWSLKLDPRKCDGNE
jgi:hypothetical protein